MVGESFRFEHGFVLKRSENVTYVKPFDSPSCLHFYSVLMQVIRNEALIVLAYLTRSAEVCHLSVRTFASSYILLCALKF